MKSLKIAIIRYVKRVFKDSGKPPSVSEILKKFKISSRTFYKYFSSIDELYSLANIPMKTKSKDRTHQYYQIEVNIAREKIRMKLDESYFKLIYYLRRLKEDHRVNATRLSAMRMYTDVVNRLDKARNFKELEVAEEYVRKVCMLYDMWFNEMRDRYIWARAQEEYVRWTVDKIVK